MRRVPIGQLTNPYIAFADVFLNMGMIFLLFILLGFVLGSKGWDNLRYRSYQEQMREAMRKYDHSPDAPIEEAHNDAPGEQRWVFKNIHFSQVGGRAALTEDSQARLAEFVRVLKILDTTRPEKVWHRVRIEANVHAYAQPVTKIAEARATEIAAERAVVVEEFFYSQGRISPNKITSSSRGDQDIDDKKHPESLSNDRIDVLVISPAYDGLNPHAK